MQIHQQELLGFVFSVAFQDSLIHANVISLIFKLELKLENQIDNSAVKDHFRKFLSHDMLHLIYHMI